jgi:hypothetical protein
MDDLCKYHYKLVLYDANIIMQNARIKSPKLKPLLVPEQISE